MTIQRWECTSYCLCGSRKGHFEKSDEGVWVLYESAQAQIAQLRGSLSLAEEGLANYAQEVERLKAQNLRHIGRIGALAAILYGPAPFTGFPRSQSGHTIHAVCAACGLPLITTDDEAFMHDCQCIHQPQPGE